jgi:hypothetical protein
MTKITQKRLKEVLEYDPDTGVFRWKYRPREKFNCDRTYRAFNGKFEGMRAGTVAADGYRRLSIDGNVHSARNLAWLYVKGYYPTRLLSINKDRDDCRIENLKSNAIRHETFKPKPVLKWL